MSEYTLIPQSSNIAPGTWLRESERDVLHRCPKCKVITSLRNHRIAENGTVDPPITCEAPCKFSVWGKLEGWTFGVKEAEPST